jgi:hypothetical protein
MAKATYFYGKRDLMLWQKRSAQTGVPGREHIP